MYIYFFIKLKNNVCFVYYGTLKMTSQYKWPRENLNEYKFDAGWPNDVKLSDIVVPFTSWAMENEYRIAQRNRHAAIAAAEKRDKKLAFDWNFAKPGLI